MSSPRPSPLGLFFLTLSRMPPALMLLVIIGSAILVTMMVTGRVAQKAQEREELGESRSSRATMAPVIVSKDKILEGSTITKEMVKQSRLSERTIWEDAITTVPNAVGRETKHSIPAFSQIREQDLK